MRWLHMTKRIRFGWLTGEPRGLRLEMGGKEVGSGQCVGVNLDDDLG